MDPGPHRRDQVHDTSTSSASAVVVVGIDGSDTSWDAFCWACGETRRLGGRTVAVFVGPTSARHHSGGLVWRCGRCLRGDPTDNDRSGRGAGRPDSRATVVTTVSTSHSSTLMGTRPRSSSGLPTPTTPIYSSSDDRPRPATTSPAPWADGLSVDIMPRSSLSCPDESVATGDLAFLANLRYLRGEPNRMVRLKMSTRRGSHSATSSWEGRPLYVVLRH